jgi:uncharacterized protein (UPF0333 family)
MLRKIKNKKGQIGEILVVVILIILAVMGVMKYVMPMFNKSDALQSKSSGQVDAVSNATKIESGEIVSGAAIQGVFGQMRSQVTAGTIAITPKSGTAVSATSVTSSTSYTTTFGNFINTTSNYKVTTLTPQANGDIAAVAFTEQ